MSLIIRNLFIGKVAKGAIPINAFFAFLILQPFEPTIPFSTMTKELVIQATVAAGLISLLFPIGIRKQMVRLDAKPSKWKAGTFNHFIYCLIPENKYLALPVWMLIAAIFFQLPTYLLLTALNVTEMTGWGYFTFKMIQSWLFCVPFSYLVIINNISVHDAS